MCCRVGAIEWAFGVAMDGSSWHSPGCVRSLCAANRNKPVLIIELRLCVLQGSQLAEDGAAERMGCWPLIIYNELRSRFPYTAILP